MKTAISYRKVSTLAHPEWASLVDKLADRHIARYVSHFPAELVRLRATLERGGHRSLFRARLWLQLPSATLACADQAPGLGQALEHAFNELERQLERHLARLRHEDEWRRKERRAGLRQLKVALANRAEAELAQFAELVRPLLPELSRFAQRELAYLQARGDLAPGEPLLDEIIDETLARACENLPERPRKLLPLQWLYQIALDLLTEEVTRRQTEEGWFISLESKAPVQLREPRDDEDEILFEYWQPDEKLRLEDLTPAADDTPEEIVGAREMRQLLTTLLTDLPTSWRRALMLCRVEGLPLAAAAKVLGTNDQELEGWLNHADAFLKSKLGELRLTPRWHSEPGGYIEPGVPPAAAELTQGFDEVTQRGARPQHPRR